MLRNIDDNGKRMEILLVDILDVSTKALETQMLTQSVMMNMVNKMDDLLSVVNRNHVGTFAHPSARQSSLSVSRGNITLNSLGYTTPKDLFVDSVVVVLEGYLIRVRAEQTMYLPYATEILPSHVKPMVCALIKILGIPVPGPIERPSIDLAKTLQEVIRGSMTADRFSILNPKSSYGRIMLSVWTILVSMKKIVARLPLNVRLALLCVVSGTLEEEYHGEAFMVPNDYEVKNLEKAKRYSSRSSKLSIKRLELLTAVCMDASLSTD